MDSPPKKIETLEDQQVITIARVKTSPTKRSKKYNAVNKAYLSSNTHASTEDSNDAKAKGETNILNVAGSVGSKMRNWMSPKQKRKHRSKPKVKRSLSLEIKDLFMGLVHNNGNSSSSNLRTESRQKNRVSRSPSPLKVEEEVESETSPKRSTSFTSLIPTNIRLHTGKRSKTRAVSATSLTTIKLVEVTSSTTDEDENTECSITNVSPTRQNQRSCSRQESIEKSADDESSIMSNLTSSIVNDYNNGRVTPGTEEKGVDNNANNIGDSLNTQREHTSSPEKERVITQKEYKKLRYSKRERKRWKQFQEAKEQVRFSIR